MSACIVKKAAGVSQQYNTKYKLVTSWIYPPAIVCVSLAFGFISLVM